GSFMRLVRGLTSLPSEPPEAVVALGVFDGIHLGHHEILARAVGRARALGLEAVACTFEPHPMEVLHPERVPLPITTLGERLELMAGIGIDDTVILPFTR